LLLLLVGVLCGSYLSAYTNARVVETYSAPVDRDRSTVVTGATTMKGTLCRWARTAA
jgi:hypothetical protein